MARETTRRRRAPATRAKVTVTIPLDVLEAALETIKSRHLPSLSAYVSEALAERVGLDHDEDDYLAWLNQLSEELGEPTREDYEWARNVLQL